MNRRDFLIKSTAAGLAIPLFHLGSASAVSSTNRKIHHASFGAAGQAFSDLMSFSKNDLFELTAVAEVDDRQLSELLQRFPDVRIYKDWRELLRRERGNLDSVSISVPDHMHAIMTIAAMKEGLPVYCQKPLAHNIAELRAIAKLAESTGLITQMGTQLSSSIYERLTVQLIRDGWIGRIQEVFVFSNKTWGDLELLPERMDPIPPELDWDLWCGVAPKADYIEGYYHPGNWRKRLDYGTGTLGDMGCHIFSGMFRALGLKHPIRVKSLGGVPNATNWAIDGWFEYTFPGNEICVETAVKVTWADGSNGIPPAVLKLIGGVAPEQGTVFIGESGTLLAPHFERPVCYPLEKFHGKRLPRLEPRDHYMDFLDAVRGEPVQPIADFVTYGAPLSEIILLGGIASHFPMKSLEWDAASMMFRNEPEADKFIRRQYRKGWEIPEIA